jgi:hypothetical protein
LDRNRWPLESASDLVVARPGVLANRTRALFSEHIEEFEALLKTDRLREADIQSFLERHPQLLEALGYGNVYSQVMLEREDGSYLKPDFILEPIGEDWADILDIKLPDVRIAVGSRDRKTFSAAVHELAAQLREYAAYFEDERLAKRVQDKYGIRAYRPRLIGVVGLDPHVQDERQLRRMMTVYSDLHVLTFDQLLEVARKRVLI